jgi:hypothetical protein
MKIFMSYSHEDSKLAGELSQELTKKGIGVWRDLEQTSPGDLITSKISDGLSGCMSYCVLISRHSMSSKWVELELSAAVSRWAKDPSFKVIPVLLEHDSLPPVLKGMLFIPAINESAPQIAEKILSSIFTKNLKSEISSIDWEPLLSAIEKDQFNIPGSHCNGGWSRSYALNFLPLAFPNQVPNSVSSADSISVTQCVIRGLNSFRRILSRTKGNDKLSERIESLFSRARDYLMRHFMME